MSARRKPSELPLPAVGQMISNRPRSWVRAVLLSAVGLGIVAGCTQEPAAKKAPAPVAPLRLTVITPHNAAIRETFEMGFSDWHRAKRGTQVTIDWIVRGTPQCVAYVHEVFNGPAGRDLRETPEVMFGGGIADHELLAERGHSRELSGVEGLDGLPAEVRGLPTRDAKLRWFATGLSSFGIVYNAQLCRQRGIEPPRTWADLADPRMHGWVGLADPSASGSHRQCMLLVLQTEGWEKGWGTLLRILANARALNGSSAEVLSQIQSGVALAGFAVNFDGLALAEESGGRIAYVNPPGGTAAMPDVVSVLRTAGNVQLATDFVSYCLSPAGQEAWGLRGEARSGFGHTLYHYPLSPDMYATQADKLSVAENPYEFDFGPRVDAAQAQRQAAALVPLVRAACGVNHVDLQKAWEAALAAGSPSEVLTELFSPPCDEEKGAGLGEAYARSTGAEADRLLDELVPVFARRYESALQKLGAGKSGK